MRCALIIVNACPTGASDGHWDLPSRFVRFVVTEGARRTRDDNRSDDQRQHRSVYRRMNKEKPASCSADDKRDKHTAHAAAFIAGYGYSIGQCAEQEDEGSRRSSRKYAADVQVANSSALHSHCQRPRGQENGNDVVSGPGAAPKPYQHEAEMGQ